MQSNPPLYTRRAALKQIAFFSAALGVPLASRRVQAAPAVGEERHFLMIGDFGRPSDQAQAEVAAAMQRYVKTQGIKTDGMFLLGDNFYGSFKGGVKSPRWQSGFEEMYPAAALPGPCWATLGNHDYNEELGVKMEAQLTYATANPGTRWTMPAKWYRVDFPQQNPLFTLLSLDSNFNNRTQSLTPAERRAQLSWLKAELAKPRVAPWLFVQAHHPLYSNGKHGDTKALIEEWGPLFQQYQVPFYFCGHDHDLQHLEFEGLKTSFVVSGGGGAKLYDVTRERGPFAEMAFGFTHLQVSRGRVIVRHIDPSVKQLYAFAKTPDGKVTQLG